MKRLLSLLVSSALAASCLVTAAGRAQAAAPANDDIANATQVGELPFTDITDTREATLSADEVATQAAIGCTVPATVWYVLTATSDARLVVDTSESDYSAFPVIFSGSPGALTYVAGGCQYPPIVFTPTAGTTYYILVGTNTNMAQVGQVGPGGSLMLSVSLAPPPLTRLTMTIHRKARVGRDGTVTITGSVSCDRPGDGDFGIRLRQKHGVRIARSGWAFDLFSCSADRARWTIQLSARTKTQFRTGPGRVGLTAEAGNISGGAVIDMKSRSIVLVRGS